MTIGILKETGSENRVALTPDLVAQCIKLNTSVLVENGAGLGAFFPDEAYEKAGANLAGRKAIFAQADCILTVTPPPADEISTWGAGKILAGGLDPFNSRPLIDALIATQVTSFSLELLPRTTLAQSMDILSSMATIAGYRAVLEAASLLPRFFPMFMTAAGTVKPAKVLILGAGVAGLQALATARRLGAVVEVFDVRSVVKEEVMSLGGKFIEVEGAQEDASAGGYAVEQSAAFKQKQADLIHQHALKSEVVICTAQIPGKQAPRLIAKETVESMAGGSIIVDLASASGGNCELTRNNEVVTHGGVTLLGRSDYPSRMPLDASRMFGNNLMNFTRLFLTAEGFIPPWNDEIIQKSCLTREGKLVNERIVQFYSIP
jgi:NAD(P) transhydrogenase subunit alpha